MKLTFSGFEYDTVHRPALDFVDAFYAARSKLSHGPLPVEAYPTEIDKTGNAISRRETRNAARKR